MSAAFEEARRLDAADALAGFREEFVFPERIDGRSPVYLCGNSLGLMPRRAADAVRAELDAWGRMAVRGHAEGDNPWLPAHRRAAEPLAALVGGTPGETVAMNTLTVNLHLLMASFYRPEGERRCIVIESDAFPSDRYAAASQIAWHGHDPERDLLEWYPPEGGNGLCTGDLAALLERRGHEIALLLLPSVQYYTGQCLDMAEICRLAQRHGVTVGLDLAHAIGNVPLSLHDWGADFAVWCSYKYLNGGPGAIAGAWVHERHCRDRSLPRLLGWWGHEESTRFRMTKDFTPAPGADIWQLSNPPVLALAPVIASLELFEAAGIGALREKSLALTGYLRRRLEERFPGGFGILTPEDPRGHGAQLSLVVRGMGLTGRDLFKNLERLNVITDWREPDVIRVAPVPLYNSYADIEAFLERLAEAAAMTQTLA
ncbi:kynureninase [Lentisalinibacter sediminis]|uniref:kynureninase n=1 Tax=Lentisalinibacter sediminis TaxID=2992237 RepID=UPI0038700EEB